jgi:hypothetical protein
MSRRASKKAAEKAAKDAKRKANAAAWAAATPQQKRTAYIIMGVIGAVIAVIVIVAAVSSHSGGSGGGTGGGGHPDPSVMLAQEDGSTDYATYTAALDNWAADCTQTRYQAAAIVHGTFEVEQQHDCK